MSFDYGDYRDYGDIGSRITVRITVADYGDTLLNPQFKALFSIPRYWEDGGVWGLSKLSP